MMTYQEALNYLNNAQVGMKSIESVCEASDLIETCKKAIEKQIPVEHHHTKLTVFSCARQSVCPKCLHIIITNTNEYPKYCSECGQKLNWGF